MKFVTHSVFTLIYKVPCISFELSPLTSIDFLIKEKKRKRKINNDLVVWPSHNSHHIPSESKCILQKSCKEDKNRCIQLGKDRCDTRNTIVAGTQP